MTFLEETQNLILDFSHVYPEYIEQREKGLKRIDCSDISGTNMYCTKEAEAEIRERLMPYEPCGIHFLDSGNYHYVTKLFAEKINYPFSLVLFDHHNDMQQPMIHELTSCGSWAGEMLRENPYLEQMVLVGPNEKSIEEIAPELRKKLVCISIQEIESKDVEKELSQIRTELPVYISIDKDVLNRYSARTNWNQGSMSAGTLKRLLLEVFLHQKVIGVDICGECALSESFQQFMEDERVNEETNVMLYHFLSPYFA